MIAAYVAEKIVEHFLGVEACFRVGNAFHPERIVVLIPGLPPRSHSTRPGVVAGNAAEGVVLPLLQQVVEVARAQFEVVGGILQHRRAGGCVSHLCGCGGQQLHHAYGPSRGDDTRSKA